MKSVLVVASRRRRRSRPRTSIDARRRVHTHAVVINATQDRDGQWRSLEPRAFYQLQKEIGAIYPRDVRETIWQLRNNLAHLPESTREVVPFLVARAISPGARDILREERIGFYDLGGTLYIPAKHAFVHIDRPAPRKSSKIFESVFQGRKARVVQAVFARREDWLSVKEIAEETEVSPATASATLSEMERREWVDVEGAGPTKLRRLRSPRLLLDAWAIYIADQKPPKMERYYVQGAEADEVAQRLDQACLEADAAYAVTSEAAAQAYAPYLSNISQVRCRITPGPKQRDALEILRARPVTEGWNLRWPSGDEIARREASD